MNGLKHGWKLLLCAAACLLPVCAQELPESLVSGQAPPAFGVLDPGGFFNRNAGALKRISDRIRQLEKEHGYLIYVVVEPVLIATNPSERAAELRQSWLPEGNGLVLVFESDSRNLGVGRDVVGEPVAGGNSARLPSFETAAILGRAMDSTDRDLAPDVYLETLVGKLADEFDAYFKRRDTPPPAARSMKIGMLVAGTLALLGLGAIGVGGLMRHSSMAAVRIFRFPVVDRPERLGAPCGGNVTSRRFVKPGPPRPAAANPAAPPPLDRQVVRQDRGKQVHQRVSHQRHDHPERGEADDEIAKRNHPHLRQRQMCLLDEMRNRQREKVDQPAAEGDLRDPERHVGKGVADKTSCHRGRDVCFHPHRQNRREDRLGDRRNHREKQSDGEAGRHRIATRHPQTPVEQRLRQFLPPRAVPEPAVPQGTEGTADHSEVVDFHGGNSISPRPSSSRSGESTANALRPAQPLPSLAKISPCILGKHSFWA